MFVAHPDDDALWGGAHLVQNKGKFLVVCITCGVRKDRALEFETAMKKLNNPYLMKSCQFIVNFTYIAPQFYHLLKLALSTS